MLCPLVTAVMFILLQKGQRDFEQKCGEYEELIQETKQQLEVRVYI